MRIGDSSARARPTGPTTVSSARGGQNTAAAAKVAPSSEKTPLKVMTFNIRGLRGIPGIGFDPAEAEKIAQTIVRENPDVILFQEVDRGTTRGGGHDQLDWIRDRVDALTQAKSPKAPASDVVFGASLTKLKSAAGSTGQYGNAIMARNGLVIAGGETAEPFELPGGTVTRDGATKSSERRTALAAEILTPSGKTFTAIATHLATESEELRNRQLDALAKLAKEKGAEGPVVLGGDFNMSAVTGPVKEFGADSGLVDAFSAAGIGPADPRRRSLVLNDGFEGFKRKAIGWMTSLAPGLFGSSTAKYLGDLDRIYTTGAEVKETRVVDVARSTDHNAVVSNLEL